MKGETRPTVKQLIRALLTHTPRMQKGNIEDALRQLRKTYGDNTARRLREMVAAGELLKVEDKEGLTCYELALTDLMPAATEAPEARP